MRKFILIAAAMVLASASAQAQSRDSRSLSTTGLTTTMPNDRPAPPREPRADDSLRAFNDTPSTDTPRQLTETPRDDAPRYNVRPPAVDTPPATATPATTPSTTVHDQQPSDDTPPHQSRRHHAYADQPRHHGIHGTRWTTGRIIAELHRYGIYW